MKKPDYASGINSIMNQTLMMYLLGLIDLPGNKGKTPMTNQLSQNFSLAQQPANSNLYGFSGFNPFGGP